jgi:hypothetical protein
MLKRTAFRSNILWELVTMSVSTKVSLKSTYLSECAISKVKDLPDHVNESEIHFSTMLSLPSAISPWYAEVRMERYALHLGYIDYRGCHSGDRTEVRRHSLRNYRRPIFSHIVYHWKPNGHDASKRAGHQQKLPWTLTTAGVAG